MSILGNYKFTNKSHPLKGVMSMILGVIALSSTALAIYLSYRDGMSAPEGMIIVAKMRYGIAAVMAFLMAFIGEILGLVANMEKDRYGFFPVMGLVLNSIVLFVGVYILYAGI